MQNLRYLIDTILFFFPPGIVMPYCVYKLLMASYPGSKSFPLILIANIICFFFAKLMEMVMTALEPLIITPLPTDSLQIYAMTVLAALPGWAFLYLLKKLHLIHCPDRVLLYCGGLVWVIAPILAFIHLAIICNIS